MSSDALSQASAAAIHVQGKQHLTKHGQTTDAVTGELVMGEDRTTAHAAGVNADGGDALSTSAYEAR